jgi:hypothetical protein
MTEFSSKFERLRLAICRDCFDAKIGLRYVQHVEWNKRAFKLRNISIRKEITKFSSKFERLRCAICRDCIDAEIDVRYVRRVEWSGNTV